MIPKYRVYIKNLKLMLPVADIDFEIEEIGTRISDDADLLYYSFDDENIAIMQSTGLKDKNGVDIFEGDIFEFDDELWSSCYTACGTEYDSCEAVNHGLVGFDKNTARYNFVNYQFNENSVEADLNENHYLEFAEFVSGLEIKGNIFDNPELMEE